MWWRLKTKSLIKKSLEKEGEFTNFGKIHFEEIIFCHICTICICAKDWSLDITMSSFLDNIAKARKQMHPINLRGNSKVYCFLSMLLRS